MSKPIQRSPANILTFPQQAPPDAVARATALDVRTSCIVEAPAGSGKTGLLVQRLLKLLATVAQPEEVLAMTFTRKATAEMRHRVLSELQAAHAGLQMEKDNDFARETRACAQAVLARSRQLGWGLLDQPQRLNIRSLTSVCTLLTGALPLLPASGPVRPLERAGPLHRQAARSTLMQLGGTDARLDAALRNVLLHRDANLADCETLLARMLETREQWGELIPLDPTLDDARLDAEVRPVLERALEAIVCATLDRALRALPPGVLAELTAFAAEHAHLPGNAGAPSPIAGCAGLHQPPEAVAAHLDHWVALLHLLLTKNGWRKPGGLTGRFLGFDLPKTSKPRLASLIDRLQRDECLQSDSAYALLHALRQLPPARYPDAQWAVARSLFVVLLDALVRLKLLFAETGQCDFTELQLSARAALQADPALADFALAAGGTLRHLLVDELQDTSSGQYDLIAALTQSWDGHSQTLFLVGDPKQSIYLFRQARVERFLRTMQQQRLGALQLTPLHLTANFRSQAALVAGFNRTFGGVAPTADSAGVGWIFPPPDDPSLRGGDAVDVPFVHAAPARAEPAQPESQPDALHWHTTIYADHAALAAHSVAEAAQIRRIIAHRLAQPLPAGRTRPWSIAVLARARSHFREIVHALKSTADGPEVPFRSIALDPLGERPEVLDALALTRALLHPADRIAWLAVLHAPWCGLGLADLLALTGEGPEADPEATVAALVATRRPLLSAEGQRLLDRAWPVLQAALDGLGHTSLAVHVERTWLSLGGDAPLAPEARTNVQRLFSVLRGLEADTGRLDLRLLHTALADLYAEPRAGEVQVELMTIHNAKGLEWDLVLVPGLHRRPRRSDGELLEWAEFDDLAGVGASVVLAPIAGKGGDSGQLNRWLRGLRARRDRAEEKRLFYVACTRAREQLHLFAALPRTAKGELAAPHAASLLRACWPAAEPHFAAAQHTDTQPAAAQSPAPTNLTAFPTPSVAIEFEDDFADDGLSIAAAAAEREVAPTLAPPPPLLHRLPLSFDPGARFREAAAHRLPYAPAATLPQAPGFDRPEGSFAVRAFGNVVHRYLQQLAERFAANPSPTAPNQLLAELPSWLPRLEASLRGEGLPPALAAAEAPRALDALTLTLADPIGRWLLAPHPQASSELSLTTQRLRTLRVDRTFLAGPEPAGPEPAGPEPAGSAAPTHIWIVDFKTTTQGARSAAAFREAELAKYREQMETYAELRRGLPDGHLPIRLGLFYPLLPALFHWPSAPADASSIPAPPVTGSPTAPRQLR